MAWRIHTNDAELQSGHYTTRIGDGCTRMTFYIGLMPVMEFRREPGFDWYVEVTGMWPVAPALRGPVTRVTFLGRPQHDGITPGLYEIGTASANVERNGEHLKMELTAPSIDAAKELYRAVLRNDASIRSVSYEPAAA